MPAPRSPEEVVGVLEAVLHSIRANAPDRQQKVAQVQQRLPRLRQEVAAVTTLEERGQVRGVTGVRTRELLAQIEAALSARPSAARSGAAPVPSVSSAGLPAEVQRQVDLLNRFIRQVATRTATDPSLAQARTKLEQQIAEATALLQRQPRGAARDRLQQAIRTAQTTLRSGPRPAAAPRAGGGGGGGGGGRRSRPVGGGEAADEPPVEAGMVPNLSGGGTYSGIGGLFQALAATPGALLPEVFPPPGGTTPGAPAAGRLQALVDIWNPADVPVFSRPGTILTVLGTLAGIGIYLYQRSQVKPKRKALAGGGAPPALPPART